MFIVKYTDTAGRTVFAPTEDAIAFIAERVADGLISSRAALECEVFRAYHVDPDPAVLRARIEREALVRRVHDYGVVVLHEMLRKGSITSEEADAVMTRVRARWPLHEVAL